MSDEDWRAISRAWLASPGDRPLLERLIEARRRAGLPVSWRLLLGRVSPPHEYAPPFRMTNWWITPAGRIAEKGMFEPSPLVPEHVLWGVKKFRSSAPDAADEWRGAAAEIEARGIPGLALVAATDPVLAQVEDVPHLRALRIWSDGLTDAGLAAVARLRELEALEIEFTETTWTLEGAGFSALRDLPDLTALWLRGKYSDMAVSPGLLGHVAGSLERLTALSISYIVPAGIMAAVNQLPALESLSIENHRTLADAELALVPPTLRDLRLGSCGSLTAAGFRALGAIDALESLEIRGCREFTRAVANDLRRRLPRCRFVFDEAPVDLPRGASPGHPCLHCKTPLRDVPGQAPPKASGHPTGGDHDWCEVTASVDMECPSCLGRFRTTRTTLF